MPFYSKSYGQSENPSVYFFIHGGPSGIQRFWRKQLLKISRNFYVIDDKTMEGRSIDTTANFYLSRSDKGLKQIF
jgi:hypothetical protein